MISRGAEQAGFSSESAPFLDCDYEIDLKTLLAQDKAPDSNLAATYSYW